MSVSVGNRSVLKYASLARRKALMRLEWLSRKGPLNSKNCSDAIISSAILDQGLLIVLYHSLNKMKGSIDRDSPERTFSWDISITLIQPAITPSGSPPV